MQGLIMDYRLTLRPLMERAYRLFGSNEIVTRTDFGSHRYTYSEFYERCGCLANGLVRLGIKRGDRVGTLAWNGYRHLELYFAVPCTSFVIHTINVRLPEDQLVYIINHADDRVLFVEADLIPSLERIADRLLKMTNYVELDTVGSRLPETSISNVLSYEQLLTGESPDYEWPDLEEREAAAISYGFSLHF